MYEKLIREETLINRIGLVTRKKIDLRGTYFSFKFLELAFSFLSVLFNLILGFFFSLLESLLFAYLIKFIKILIRENITKTIFLVFAIWSKFTYVFLLQKLFQQHAFQLLTIVGCPGFDLPFLLNWFEWKIKLRFYLQFFYKWKFGAVYCDEKNKLNWGIFLLVRKN